MRQREGLAGQLTGPAQPAAVRLDEGQVLQAVQPQVLRRAGRGDPGGLGQRGRRRVDRTGPAPRGTRRGEQQRPQLRMRPGAVGRYPGQQLLGRPHRLQYPRCVVVRLRQ